MRILIINYEYPPIGAGAGNASQFLAQNLVKSGEKVSVLTSAYGDNRGIRNEEGVKVHRIPAFRKKQDRSTILQMIFFAISGTLRSTKIVQKDKIDCVIVFFTIPSGICGYWLKIRLGLPYIVSLRGGDVPGLVPSLDSIHNKISWLRQSILNSATSVVANSRGLADLAMKKDKVNVEIIPNGIDCKLFHPLAYKNQSKDPVFQILFVGRLHEQKNLPLLLNQLSFIKNLGYSNLNLHVVGDGHLKSDLQKLAKDLGCKKQCRLAWVG